MPAFVEAARFSTVEEAHIARGFLQSHGIDAKLFDDAMTSMGLGYQLSVGVRLMIPEDQVEAATALLKTV